MTHFWFYFADYERAPLFSAITNISSLPLLASFTTKMHCDQLTVLDKTGKSIMAMV